MHQALYRKYRPAVFSDVVGQTHITSVLRYQVKEKRTSHAYLFCGSRGTGKTTCAKILAKAVNCTSPIDGDPCGKCENCRAIESGATTDVIEMDAASNTGVDYIRDIKDEVMYAPTMLQSRVYIIDEVHMLSDGAFNALLKTLEEPPEHVLFILATTEQQKIPATILSRCQRFEFRRIPADVICSRLAYIAREENVDLCEDAARLIARAAQGGMRDAISLFELCSSDGEAITPERVEALSGGVGRRAAEDTVRAILDRDGRAIFDIVASIYASTGDLGVYWQQLIGYYRDMTVCKTLRDMPKEELRKEILDLTEGEFETLTAFCERFRYETLLYHSTILEGALPSIGGRIGSTGRISAEMALIRLTVPKLDAGPEALLERISKLEDAIMLGKTPETQTKNTEAPVLGAPVPSDGSAPVNNGKKEVSEKTPAGASRETPEVKSAPSAPEKKEISDFVEIRQALRSSDPAAAGLLEDARAFDLMNGTIEILTSNELFAAMLEDAGARETLARIFEHERGIKAQIIINSAGGGNDGQVGLFDLE